MWTMLHYKMCSHCLLLYCLQCFGHHLMLYKNKIAQCSLVCHNSSPSCLLCTKMDCLLSRLDDTPLRHHYLGVLFTSFFDISCIKCVVAYFTCSSFIGIVFKAVIKCLCESSGLSCKVISIFLFLTHTSKESELIRKYFGLVNVVQQVITLLPLTCEGLAANKKEWWTLFSFFSWMLQRASQTFR